MFSIEAYIRQNYPQGATGVWYSQIFHHKYVEGGSGKIDHSKEGAGGYLIHGIDYSTQLVSGSLFELKCNSFTYWSYVSQGAAAGYYEIPHVEFKRIADFVTTDAKFNITIHYQWIKWLK